MPRLSQLMIRTALIWLGLGYTAGGILLAHKGVPLAPELWGLRGVHVHVLMVGWTAQLAMGVAFWILPRLDASGSRGDERPVWLCFGALNTGVISASVPGILMVGGRLPMVWLNALAGLLYVTAGLAFVIHAWPRIVPFRTLPRPSQNG